MTKIRSAWGCVLLGLLASSAGAVNIELVTVGNPGNPGELSGQANGTWAERVSGRVDYTYRIGKFEITAGQYTDFLNAVAKTADTYGLYNQNMYWSSSYCKIRQTGTAGNYVYSVAPDYANRPVDLIGWGDAARFCNWMHNGQPTGQQDLRTTEDGSYLLNGAMNTFPGVTRKPDATWVIPTEDEWYKAAYHKNDGVTGNYWDYPTASDEAPSNELGSPTDPGNNATYGAGPLQGGPYYRTEVGAHENSMSAYGTFDQGGNVWEWTETLNTNGTPTGPGTKLGGSYDSTLNYLHAANRLYGNGDIGFRVAYLPEPASVVLLLAATALGFSRKSRRR